MSGPFTCGFLGRHLNPSLALGLLLVRTQNWDACLEQMSEVSGGALSVHHETWADLCLASRGGLGLDLWVRGEAAPLLLPRGS